MKRAMLFCFVAFLLALSLVSFNSLSFKENPLKERGGTPSFVGIETAKDASATHYVSDNDFSNQSYIFLISFILAITVYVGTKRFRNYS